MYTGDGPGRWIVTASDVQLRQAEPKDAGAIAAVVQQVVLDPEPVGLTPTMEAEQVASWLHRQADQGCIVLAELNGQIVGFGALDFSTEAPDDATIGVWILPQWRRRGIATQVGEWLIDFARQAGYRRIRGRLPSGNEAALSFLSSLGALVPLRNPNMTFELPL